MAVRMAPLRSTFFGSARLLGSLPPITITAGGVAGTTEQSGSVLQGDVLHGIGVAAAPVNQPNRTGSESETGQSDKTGEPGSTGQPSGRPGGPNH